MQRAAQEFWDSLYVVVVVDVVVLEFVIIVEL